MTEIGSFIELQFEKNKEYYSGDFDVARLNSGRAAIYHAIRVTGLKTIWLPYYQCDTVRNFLINKNITIKYYHINNLFEPLDIIQEDNECVLLVNYFGVMSDQRMAKLAAKFKNVIIDNCQAFFARPLKNCLNVYSCRKFVGVPDGSYVIGKNAHKYVCEYKKCYSSDTSIFLLQRIEYGCENKSYEARKINENRIDTEDVLKMSDLTRTILSGSNYKYIARKRKANFRLACKLFDSINLIKPKNFAKNGTVPMVYPLVLEDDKIFKALLNGKHFQGRWWDYLLSEVGPDTFEYWISKNIIPVTIDQRYGRSELNYIAKIIKGE